MTPCCKSLTAYVAYLVAHPWLVVGAVLVAALCTSLVMLWWAIEKTIEKEDGE